MIKALVITVVVSALFAVVMASPALVILIGIIYGAMKNL